jgi:hypothetical protein
VHLSRRWRVGSSSSSGATRRRKLHDLVRSAALAAGRGSSSLDVSVSGGCHGGLSVPGGLGCSACVWIRQLQWMQQEGGKDQRRKSSFCLSRRCRERQERQKSREYETLDSLHEERRQETTKTASAGYAAKE